MKQISLTIPDVLFLAAKRHAVAFGYKSLQELILELVRDRVVAQDVERWKRIEREMATGKKKVFSQDDAVRYLKEA